MLLSHIELLLLIDNGIITAPETAVNATSIDVTLGDFIQVERAPHGGGVVDLAHKQSPAMCPIQMTEAGYALDPSEFVLGHTIERFNLPNDISAEFKLKSSLARSGLNHALAGWCDAGWNSSQLTLELTNATREHRLLIRPGMKIGQVIFYRHYPVPDHASYASRGQYNGSEGAVASKGVR